MQTFKNIFAPIGIVATVLFASYVGDETIKFVKETKLRNEQTRAIVRMLVEQQLSSLDGGTVKH